jgi:hypothetical protein
MPVNRIGNEMVSVLAPSVVDRVFEPRSGQGSGPYNSLSQQSCFLLKDLYQRK